MNDWKLKKPLASKEKLKKQLNVKDWRQKKLRENGSWRRKRLRKSV